MTSIRDRLKNQIKAEGKNFTKLDVDRKLNVKLDKSDNKVKFGYYDSEKKEDVFLPGQIHGILVGKCMQATWFDPNIGQNGGNWFTGYYATKNKVSLFKPGPQGVDHVMTATLDEVDQYLLSKGVRAAARKYQVYLVRMKTRTGESITVAINSSLVIAITQSKKYTQETPFDFYVTLTPKEYVKGDIEDSKVPSTTLALMEKNPPKYASISFDKPINDIDFEGMGAHTAIENFQKWLQEQKGEAAQTQQETAASQNPEPNSSGNIDDDIAAFDAPSGSASFDEQPVDDFDLPF